MAKLKLQKFTVNLFLLISLFGCATTRMNKLHPISIVYIDEKTEKVIGDFPVKRNHYVDLVKKIQKYKPHAVVLKFFLDSRKKEDRLFNEIKKYRVYTQASAVKDSSEYKGKIKGSLGENKYNFEDNKSVIYPNKRILRNLDGVGFVDAPTNSKGQPYSFYLVRSYRGELFPSLPIKILEDIKMSPASINSSGVRVGKKTIPMNNKGIFDFDYDKHTGLYREYSFIDVLDQKLPLDTFKNHIVVVFYKGKKLAPIKATNEHHYNPAEVVSDAINNVLIQAED